MTHQHRARSLCLEYYFVAVPSLADWFLNSFLVLNPFHPAWIFVAAILQFCNSLRILKPFQLAWILVADFSSIDNLSMLWPLLWPFFIFRLFLNCFLTRYPFHWAWILVAASSSDWDELGLDGWMALICMIGIWSLNKSEMRNTFKNFLFSNLTAVRQLLNPRLSYLSESDELTYRTIFSPAFHSFKRA